MGNRSHLASWLLRASSQLGWLQPIGLVADLGGLPPPLVLGGLRPPPTPSGIGGAPEHDGVRYGSPSICVTPLFS